MEPFTILRSQVVVLFRNDIDTDQIIPSRYTLLPRKAEMAEGLFGNWREEDPDFPLNDPRARQRRILVAGENFGCGSSREHAVWALVGHGFRAVVARSFGDIFRNNALKNGLLLVELDQAQHHELVSALSQDPELEIFIDLPQNTLSVANAVFHFSLDSFSHELLVQAHDELGYLLQRKAEIGDFERTRAHPTTKTKLARRRSAPTAPHS